MSIALRLVRLGIRRPWLIIGLWLGLAALAAYGNFRLRIDTTTSSILDTDSPEWETYQRSLELFGGDEVVAVAFAVKPGQRDASLARLEEFTEAAAAIAGVRRVDSLVSVPLIRAETGMVAVEPAVRKRNGRFVLDEPLSQLVSDPVARRVLLSSRGDFLAANVFLDRDVGSEVGRVVEEVQALAGSDALISGVPVFRTEANQTTRQELLVFAPITLVLMGLLLCVVFRRPIAVVVPLASAGLASWLTTSLLGFAGRPLTAASMILPSLLLALGTAYCMHVLAAAKRAASGGSLEEEICRIARPLVYSGLTTAVGFAAIGTVRIESAQELGLLGAVGVLLVLGASLTLAPAVLSFYPLGASGSTIERLIRVNLVGACLRLATQRRHAVMLVWVVGLGFASVGLLRLKVSTDLTLWFDRGTEIRESYEIIREEFSGISPVNILIESAGESRATEPETFRAIGNLTSFLESLPHVGRAFSYAVPVAQLHEAFDGSQAAPPTEEAVEQYLLLLESMEPINDLITANRMAANVALRVDDNGSAEIMQLARAGEDWWRRYGSPGFSVSATGIMYEFARAEEVVAYGQLTGICVALGAIGFLLWVIFRQVSVALIALVPNLIPLVAVFGAMGWLGVPLDIGNIVLGSLALGIAVDDTIHVVSDYCDNRFAGASPDVAIGKALGRVAPAMTYTTAALVGGFGVFGLSAFAATQALGLLTAAMVGLCWAADMTLLPAVLARKEGKGSLKLP